MTTQRFDLVVIGSGSGNLVIPEDESWRVAIIDSGAFGGTCLNRGCIPSKMLIHPADVAHTVAAAPDFGIDAALNGIRWQSIRDQVFERTDSVAFEGRNGRQHQPHVTVFDQQAHLVSPHELQLEDGSRLWADQIVLAAGSSPTVPPVIAESAVPFHTSDTIMRIDELPQSMIILGGGYIAIEQGHLFSSFGVEVHIVELADTLLSSMDPMLGQHFTELARRRWDVHTGAEVVSAVAGGGGVEIGLSGGRSLSAETLLVAVGRKPNTKDLGVGLAGGAVDDAGFVVVDDYGRAGDGLWALGDCISSAPLKHVANAEARAVAHNLSHPDNLRPLPHEAIPAAVFGDPQVATVGARRQDLQGRAFVEAEQPYSATAYGWALQDTDGRCLIYADPTSGEILGAHIIGYQAALLITPLIQAIAHHQSVAEIARGQYWIHPALSEVVEQALLAFDVAEPLTLGQFH